MYFALALLLALSDQPALVFDPNPVAAINDPSLMDENDSPASVPGHAYAVVTVDLNGPNVRIIDRQSPATTQPDPNAPLMFNRGDDRFEAVNATFHIDREQKWLQSLGFTGSRQVVAYPIEVDPLAVSGADTSFFLPMSSAPGYGTLFFGSGGTDDAEDADLVVHEYGHAILEWVAPGTFAGAFSSEARAFSEGFGDYLAFSAHYDARVRSGRDPFCFADWDARCWTDAPTENCAYPAGSDCLRRLDSPRTMADYQTGDVSGVEHRNGMIWSSAMREIFLKLGRRATDTLAIESLFGAPPHPTFAVMARRMLEADRLLYGGAHRDAICAAMTARGIAVTCDGAPRGELTFVPGASNAIAIPENDPAGIVSRITVDDVRTIRRIGVRVDIEHPSRGDLRIELVAPDGTRVLLQNVSLETARDIHATFGIDAAAAESLDALIGRSAAGTWELRTADLRARDAGTLQSWALVLQLAGDEPQAQRPRGGKTQMIPVVAHLTGWTSDVRLANVTASAQTATLIFTRSGEDGTTSFSAVQVRLASGQTVAFDDVVASAFFTTGSGSLEVLGDVLVLSRLAGQQIPPATNAGVGPFHIPKFPDPTSRANVGITETAGAAVIVTVATHLRRLEIALPPFSHTQIALQPSEIALFTGDVFVAVSGGTGRIAAYVSQIDRDAVYLTGTLFDDSGRLIAPAIGLGRWKTDLLITGTPTATYVTDGSRFPAFVGSLTPDVVRTAFARPETAGMIVTTATNAYARVTGDGTTQLIPFFRGDGPPEQHLLFIENGGGFRTNIGIVAEGPAAAEVIVRDAAGAELQRIALETPGGMAQLPVSARVQNGRATVRFIDGKGRGYASLIDESTGDATFVGGQ